MAALCWFGAWWLILNTALAVVQLQAWADERHGRAHDDPCVMSRYVRPRPGVIR